jgi:endonuclease III
MTEDKAKRVADLLLRNRDRVQWDWICDGMDTVRANKFLLGSILNYQMRAGRIFEIVTTFVATHIKNPRSLWDEITNVRLEDWKSRFADYRLHRFPQAHARVWLIGKKVADQYGGDASRIWADSTVQEVQKRLEHLGAGEQISRMIVGALCDTGWLENAGGDVKADRHVNRVVGRVFTGELTSSKVTIELTRLMDRNPWLLDKPLFDVGKKYCHPKSPECAKCYLRAECCFAARSAI